MVQIKRPLDFEAVTDHSEYMGTVRLANDPQSDLSKLPIAEKLKVKSKEDVQKVYLFLATSIITEPIKELISPEVAGSVWKRVVEAADKYYQPGKFTTFAAYEWSSTPDNRNLHRNIIFKDSKKVPALPFSSIDSSHPEDLWNWMDGQRKAGNEVLAISHNANLSDGVMFPLEVDSKGRPIDAAWAQSRVNNEPLSEIQQLKGASETHPALSPNDEFARHEILEYLLGGVDRAPRLHGSYIREAYENGLAMQDTRGYNPYKFGVVGASDTHGTAAAHTQSNYFGGHGLLDATPQARISGVKTSGLTMDQLATSGLGGVWAEENTREAIFAAMQRKETFGTSGVRIKVRFFGGWDFAPNVAAKQGLGQGRVRERRSDGRRPAGREVEGADLHRLGGQGSRRRQSRSHPDREGMDAQRPDLREDLQRRLVANRKANSGGRISDARVRRGQAELPPVGNTVDIKNASYTNTIGAVELKTVWTDPDFDASQFAFYYARVLQIPTPRWTTYDAKKLGVPPPSNVPATVQDRAWTSPIWYSPSEEARKAAKPGTTVADLQQRGAVALDDAQLKQLIVGKTFKVRNTVTGQRFEILYGLDGRRLILSVDGKQPPHGEVGDVLHSGELGSPAHYEIRGGKIVTTIANTPFEITVYKVGDKYVAARSNEFGYANYEVE